MCSNWGGFLRQDLQCDYLVIGEPTYYSKGECSLYQSDGKRISFKIKDLASLFHKYNAFYITVDMDVLKNGIGVPKRTNWNEGIMLKEQLMSYLDLLPDDKIISADITGLPPFETAKLTAIEKHLTQYITDIDEIAEKLESKLK